MHQLKLLLFISCIAALSSCQTSGKRPIENDNEETPARIGFYAKDIKDSFYVSVALPEEYDKQKKYPVVYMLDGNFFSDMVGATTNMYGQAGMIPQVILVSIEYKDIIVMDTLRSRDYTFGTAAAQYEMTVSGGVDQFISFIGKEVSPYIDKHYSTLPSKRTLMGHSLGGLAVVYAFLHQHTDFNYYIAASPSLHYNDYALLNEMKQKVTGNNDLHLYISYGGLEDIEEAEDGDSTLLRTNAVVSKLTDALQGKVQYKVDTFTNLGHLEAAIPGFLEGLKMLNEQQED